jgi:hypothetical protein
MLASGGVCAVLDYELDQITEYVAEMAQRIVLPTSPVSPAFRKFVSGLLSSTRLPSTTILLGMNYLARRMNILNAAGPYKVNDGVVWRMLTIGLLLGSKFLDDNTFQNRSWSEVSGIPVAELNTLEHEWLEAMEWSLYVNLDESQDYTAWRKSWHDWREQKNIQRKATLDRLAPLAPIDTNVQRPRPYSQVYNGYNKAVSRPQSGFHSAYDQIWSNPYPTPHLTPPSAPDSGVNTPEYAEYLSATGGAPRWNDWAVYNGLNQRVGAFEVKSIRTYTGPTIPTPPHYPMHYGWDGDCKCASCNPYGAAYFMTDKGYRAPIIC